METIFEHNKKKISTSILIFVVILTIFFAVKIINEIKKGKYIGTGSQNTISVEGRGEIFATPNIANLTFTVVETANTVKKAQNVVTEKMNNILEFLDEKDLNEKDIKTTNYNIYPKYEWQRTQCLTYPCSLGKNILIGYEVSHSVSLKIREIDKAGEVLARLGEMGTTNVSSINFSIDKENKLREEAQALAIKNAKEKAEKLADELDVTLVRVISFSEQNTRAILQKFGSMNPKVGGFEENSVIPNIPVGENNLISKVNITYEIK